MFFSLVHPVYSAPEDFGSDQVIFHLDPQEGVVQGPPEEFPIDIKSGFGKDHGALEGDQSKSTETFVKKYFYDSSGQLSLEKADALLVRLQDETRKLHKDLYESTLLERTEVDVVSPAKTKLKMAEELPLSHRRILRLYQEYLIPTIEELRAALQNGYPSDLCQGLVHDFVRAYHIFFNPNTHMTLWAKNNGIGKIISHAFVPYKFNRKDRKKDEAINLIVEESNLEPVRKCLGVNISPSHYLSQDEIKKLKTCGFDLSRLNPGVSALWEERSLEEVEKFRRGRPEIFPTEDSQLVLNEVMLTGAASPKVEVKTWINGKLHRFKVKWGREVHVDIAASNVAFHLGFNQDTMSYRDQVKIYLGKYSYEQFISLLMAKYGPVVAINSIVSHGEEEGKEWILIQDALIEARPPEEVRILPFDPTAMDFNFRREFNGRLLFQAFINAGDTKFANMKLLLAQSNRNLPTPFEKDTRPRILLRFQDLGYTFGPSIFFNKIQKPLYWAQKYLPNEFESEGIVTRDKSGDHIKIRWNDFYQIGEVYKYATYSDMKWMARKIAALSGDDFEWCMLNSGMPKEVAQLYRYKLVSRRNEIIKAFDLDQDEEQPFVPEEIPSLKTWTSTPEYEGDEPAVKKGKLVKTHFRGKKVFLVNQQTVPYFLIGLLNASLPGLTGGHGNVSRNLGGQWGVSNAPNTNGISGLSNSLGLPNTLESPTGLTPFKVSLGVGINATLARAVLISPHDFHSNEDMKARPYLVKDVISFSIGVNSPLLQKVATWLPVGAQASLRLFEIRYEYYHFSETHFDGYKKSFMPFLKALGKSIEDTTENLGRMELVRRYMSVGFEGGVGLNLFSFEPFIRNQASGSLGMVKIEDVTHLRDQYGQLHVFSQDTDQKYAGLDLLIGQVSNPVITRLPVLGYKNTKLYYKTIQKDLILSEAQSVLSHDAPLPEGRPLKEGELNFKIESEGKISKNEKYLLFNGKGKEKADTHTKISFKDGHEKSLTRAYTKREEYTGVSTDYVAYKQKDLLVKEAKRIFITMEMDDYYPDGFVIGLKIIESFRLGKRENIIQLIEKLNRRFSPSPDLPFYHDYTLPPEDEVNEYRRVYATTRIYLPGSKLLEKIEELDQEKFLELATPYFTNGIAKKAGVKEEDRGWFSRKSVEMKQYLLERKLKDHFTKLNYQASKLERNYKKIFPLLDKFIAHQQVDKYGIDLLKELLGEENMLVMGDISGVLPSYSTANDLQQRQRRRFVAKHWGDLSLVPPIQYHIKYENLLYPTVLVPLHIQPTMMFGDLPDGYPEDLKNQN